MKTFKQTLTALATVAALSAAGSANAYLTNWYLDSDGAGGAAASLVKNYLDLNGQAYIEVTSVPSPTYTFNEAGVFATHYTGPSSTLAHDLHSTFTATGTGNIATAKVNFNDGGILNVYDYTNSLIGTFVLALGDGQLQTGTVLPNGTFSLIFTATYLQNGYFFDGAMRDLSADVSKGLTFGFATTNAIALTTADVDDATNAQLTSLYNGTYGTSYTSVSADGASRLLVSNNGQFRMEVPEPTSMALAGLGLTGLAALRRRKSA